MFTMDRLGSPVAVRSKKVLTAMVYSPCHDASGEMVVGTTPEEFKLKILEKQMESTNMEVGLEVALSSGPVVKLCPIEVRLEFTLTTSNSGLMGARAVWALSCQSRGL